MENTVDEVCPPPPCSDYEWMAKVLHVALRPISELPVDTRILFAIARRIARKWYWYPYAEGAVCEDKDRVFCNKYRMFFECLNEGKKTFTMIEINKDPDYGLEVVALTDILITEKDIDELQPLIPELEVKMVEDAELKKYLEEVKKELSQIREKKGEQK